MFDLSQEPIRRRTWIQMANLPKARVGWELGDCTDVPQADLERVSKWLTGLYKGIVVGATGKDTCGVGLLLYGLPGRGKTALAATILQEIMRHASPEALLMESGKVLVRPCYFTTFSALLDLKGATMEEPEEAEESLYSGVFGTHKSDAYNVRVLVLDDVGREHASLSGWQKSVLHHLLRTRYNNGLPTIVTSNVLKKEWAALYGDATASFVDEAFVPISMDNEDLRKM